MKSIKRGLAVFLATLLIMPTLPVSAQEPPDKTVIEADHLNPGDNAPDAGGTENNQTGSGQEDEADQPQGTSAPEASPEETDPSQPSGTPEETQPPTPEESPAGTAAPEETQTPDAVTSPDASQSPDATQAPADSASPEATDAPEASATPTTAIVPDASASPSETPAATPSGSPTATPSGSPAATPSGSPAATPSGSPAATPSGSPTATPSGSPTATPSGSPTATPSTSPTATPSATPSLEDMEIDEVRYNTGNHVWSVVNREVFDLGAGDAFFEEDGDFTINIPEENPFFPYEVQFIYEDEATNEWFMNPDDTVEIGGHTFHVSASFDGNAVTQMSLNVAGDTVIVWPEEKEFTDDGDGTMENSLLPLTERYLNADLTAFTPAELTMVSFHSIFTGDKALTDTDKVVWKQDGDDYTISQSGDRIDLSSSSGTWEMIVGEADQLAGDNIRYRVSFRTKYAGSWLNAEAYKQDSAGNRNSVLSESSPDYYGYDKESRRLDIYTAAGKMKDSNKVFISLSINPSVFGNTLFDHFKIYEGKHESPSEAMAAADLTGQICSSDMTQVNAGYEVEEREKCGITMVTFDAGGDVTGCLPFDLCVYPRDNYISCERLFERTGSGRNYVTSHTSTEISDGCEYRTVTLKPGYAANDTYYQTMEYYKAGAGSPSDVTAAYVGQFSSIADAVSGRAIDIKDALFSSDYSTAGYGADYSQGVYFTIFVGADGASDQEIYYYNIKTQAQKISNSIQCESLFERTQTGRDYVNYSATTNHVDGCYNRLVMLKEGYAVDRTYYQTMTYYKGGVSSPSDVTAAYVGQFSSIADAISMGSADIKDSLFGTDYSTAGYGADYSQGVHFTVFVGADGAADQEIYHYNIKTEGYVPPAPILGSGTDVTFTGLKNKDGDEIDCYITTSNDSYGEKNYITILVGDNADLTKLAPRFTVSKGATLHVDGSSEPEVSGESYHDFSKGAVHYGVSSEDKKNSRNYWLQILQADSSMGELYINSLEDEDAETRVEGGVVYSKREMLLDGYHGYKHDILVINKGIGPIPALSVELKSDVVQLDEYWTLKGNHDLAGMSTVNKDTSYGELPNLAKIRITAKEDVAAGADVSGTLTFKSGDTVLMILELTGTVGDPSITTTDIPQSVKYVPYGPLILNSNKYYSWNRVSYALEDGVLPAGVEVKANGEIYGVPTETGDFTFTVRMDNSSEYFKSSYMTYTLTVLENTDTNVDNSTDSGYDVTQRVQDIYISASGSPDLSEESRTFVSQGIYDEFRYVFLDGVKLTEGQDYTSASGSTRITIMWQTLLSGSASTPGTHTLGVEFRNGEDEVLKKAAQNFVVEKENGNGGGSDDDDNTGGSSDAGSSDGGSGSDSGSDNGTNTGADNGNAGAAAGGAGTGLGGTNTAGGKIAGNGAAGAQAGAAVTGTASTVTYTVEQGDTLWKIAVKFYGEGSYWQKIYAENAAVIGGDPNRIYTGQTLTIYLNQGDGSVMEGASADTAEGTAGNYYTVQEGDNLWKIALKVYGRGWRWRRIYEANIDSLPDPQSIYVGQVLLIPD